ncbi:hypothetical protein NHX12_006969 [Muraenolepis orangiensis]|uniref:Uncharacterized protein n=1 Tax=Muraenolepis orangiensis TaxID=630683 RepID=A0A9Q0IBI3_9TELE|nr:hypothetical protein NHX12_006969 [Muraenolepis orangiensis]
MTSCTGFLYRRDPVVERTQCGGRDQNPVWWERPEPSVWKRPEPSVVGETRTQCVEETRTQCGGRDQNPVWWERPAVWNPVYEWERPYSLVGQCRSQGPTCRSSWLSSSAAGGGVENFPDLH